MHIFPSKELHEIVKDATGNEGLNVKTKSVYTLVELAPCHTVYFRKACILFTAV